MLKRYYNNSKHKFVLIKCKKDATMQWDILSFYL